MTIIVKSKHLQNIRQYIGIVKSTYSNRNPDEEHKCLEVPEVTSNCFCTRFILEIQIELVEFHIP